MWVSESLFFFNQYISQESPDPSKLPLKQWYAEASSYLLVKADYYIFQKFVRWLLNTTTLEIAMVGAFIPCNFANATHQDFFP